MTSGSDDLEQELRRNLKLRRELGAEAAKGKQHSTPNSAGGSLTAWVGFCIGLVSRSLVCMQLSGWRSYETHLGTGPQSLGWPFLLSGSMRSVEPSATSSPGSNSNARAILWRCLILGPRDDPMGCFTYLSDSSVLDAVRR